MNTFRCLRPATTTLVVHDSECERGPARSFTYVQFGHLYGSDAQKLRGSSATNCAQLFHSPASACLHQRCSFQTSTGCISFTCQIAEHALDSQADTNVSFEIDTRQNELSCRFACSGKVARQQPTAEPPCSCACVARVSSLRLECTVAQQRNRPDENLQQGRQHAIGVAIHVCCATCKQRPMSLRSNTCRQVRSRRS